MRKGPGALVLVLAALAAIVWSILPPLPEIPPDAPLVTARPVVSQPTPSQQAARASGLALAPPVKAPAAFGLLAWRPESQDRGSLCAQFSEALRADQAWRSLITLEPETPYSVDAEGHRLCLRGLKAGQSYRITLAADMMADTGRSLGVSSVETVAMADLPPMLLFKGNGFILPRQGDGMVAVDTVNIETLNLELLRIHDRTLTQELRANWRSGSGGKIDYWDIRDVRDERASRVWQGSVKIDHRPNQGVTTLIPLTEMLKDRPPSLYLLVARDPKDSYRDFTTRWLLETDIGLTSYQGQDGLRLVARSLRTAQPLPGVKLHLLARSNALLGEMVTDARGQALFAPGLLRGGGGDAATAIAAYGQDDDFAFQSLALPAFDLSDRGVAGRDAPGPYDAFLYTDRGIYRPGETVHLTGLLRDADVRAVAGGKLSLVVRRPTGAIAQQSVLSFDASGGASLSWSLPASTQRGQWSATLALEPNKPPLAQIQFDVQDFVPLRLKVMASSPEERAKPGQDFPIAIDGAFLYGAPAGDLAAEASLIIETDPAPFANWAGWRFGRDDVPFAPQTLDAAAPPTDDQGHTTALATLPPVTATQPLRVKVEASLFEPGGRPASARFTRPLRADEARYLGIKADFADGEAQEDAPARFRIALVDAEGQGQSGLVAWSLISERTQYQWYRQDGSWRYQPRNVQSNLISGEVAVSADGKSEIVTPPLPWGRYRLVVHQGDTLTASRGFWAGWGRPDTQEDRPDKLIVALDKTSYQPGEIAKVTLRAPMAGRVLLSVATDRILTDREIDLPAEGATIDLPVQDWGLGAYVLATLYRPLDSGRPRDPVRAIGVSWLTMDPGERKLSVQIETPDILRPKQRVEIPVQVSGAPAGAPIRLTLAAVDEGILLLTNFASPAPESHYLRQRRLALDIRDDYSRLLDPPAGARGELRQGGDGLGGAGLPVVPTISLALYSGIVSADAQGRAVIPLDLPEFNGQIRLMAVAWSPTGIGHGAASPKLRDPLVAEISLPRFLAPGDDGRLTLLAHNIEGPDGPVRLNLRTEGPLSLTGASNLTWTLATGARKAETLPLQATGNGIGTVHLTAIGPDGVSRSRSWQMSVRAPWLPVTRERAGLLAGGGSVAFDPAVVADFYPADLSVSVNASAALGIDVPGLLQSLSRYPYGCSEQLSSRGLPLLMLSDPALRPTGLDDAARKQIQQMIDRLVERQLVNGAFALWEPNGYEAAPYVTTQVTEFLAQAQARGFTVPAGVLDRVSEMIDWAIARTAEPDANVSAYAAYVLARMGKLNINFERRIFENRLRSISSPLAMMQLAVAMELAGDRERARQALALIERDLIRQPTDFYASRLRDLAGLVALLHEIGRPDDARRYQQQLVEKFGLSSKSTNTQEQLWLLRAAAAQLRGGPASLTLTPTGASARPLPLTQGLLAYQPTLAERQAGFQLSNPSSTDVWQSVVLHGTPIRPLPRDANGLLLTKAMIKPGGGVIDATELPQHSRAIVVLTGESDRTPRDLVVVDLLPAGWEIERILRPDSEGKSPEPALTQLSDPKMAEARDDRMVAVVHTDGRQQGFQIAYAIRAVTPGRFTLPAAQVEDMYRPEIFARTETNITEVTTAP